MFLFWAYSNNKRAVETVVHGQNKQWRTGRHNFDHHASTSHRVYGSTNSSPNRLIKLIVVGIYYEDETGGNIGGHCVLPLGMLNQHF